MFLPVVFCLVAAVGPQFETAAGPGAKVGTLVGVSENGVTLATSLGKVELPADEVIELRRHGDAQFRPPPGAMHVEFVDKSQLMTREFRVEKSTAMLAVFGSDTIQVPTAWIANVRFQEQPAKIAEQWAEIVGTPRTTDSLVLRKQNALDYLSGVIVEVNADVVKFETDGEKFDVKRSRVEGLIYAAARRGLTKASLCTVVDTAGSRYEAESMALADGALAVVTPAGLKTSIPLDRLDRLEYKVEYLSDLKPESIEQLPYLAIPKVAPSFESRFHRPRFNAALEPGPLRLAGTTYTKGVSLYTRTELVYRLPEKYSRLAAVVGLDPSESHTGSVRLVISGDDKSSAEKSGTGKVLFDRIIQGSEVVPISVDLAGVRRLKVLVDFNGDEISDRVNLCQPRLMR